MPEKRRLKGKKKLDYGEIAKQTLKAVSTLTSALVLLRDKPRKLDWIAIGIAVTNVALSIAGEVKKHKQLNPWRFFDGDIHKVVPSSIQTLTVDLAENATEIYAENGIEVFSALIGEVEVYWRKYNKKIDFGPFFYKDDEENLYKNLGESIWATINSDNASLINDKIGSIDERAEFKIFETSSLKKLKKRTEKFYESNVTRSFLLEGEPGTGKSSAVRYLIGEMGLRSFRATASDLSSDSWDKRSAIDNLEGLLMALKPDVLVLDDIDRVWLGKDGLLKLFETARKHCRLIFATVNNKDSIIGAMLRVGRFDDHILFKGTDPEVLEKMLDKEDHDLIERLKLWPIAYVQNYLVTKKVLGHEIARNEIDLMESRIDTIKKKSKKEEAKT